WRHVAPKSDLDVVLGGYFPHWLGDNRRANRQLVRRDAHRALDGRSGGRRSRRLWLVRPTENHEHVFFEWKQSGQADRNVLAFSENRADALLAEDFFVDQVDQLDVQRGKDGAVDDCRKPATEAVFGEVDTE